MKSSRKNTCYCQNSITSTRSEDDRSISRCEYLTRTMRRTGKENKKVLRDRNVINNKSPIRKSSPPVSPPTPVLSPDTLAALKNAEEIIRNAQEQITEASLFTRSISSRRSVRKHFDEPPFDDDNEQLLYIRELVASKFYEYLSDSTSEENVDTSKENLAKQKKLKIHTPRLSQPKFQPHLHPKFSKTSSPGQSPLRVKQTRKQNSPPYRSPVDDKSTDTVSTAGKSSVKNDTSSKTEAAAVSRKMEENYRAPKNFQVHVVPAVHIERKLSVRHLGDVHISPDASLQQINDNVRIYDVRHESCVESNSKRSEAPGISVMQPEEKIIIESGEYIAENGVDNVVENAQNKSLKPDEMAVMTEMFDRNNEKVKINHVESTKGDISIPTNTVQKGNVVNINENTKDRTEKNYPGQSSEHDNNRQHVVEEPLSVSHSETKNAVTMQKTQNESVAEVDLITRFIESFDMDVRTLDEIQQNASDENSRINERYHMIDLRLKDIHREYYEENEEESVNENSYLHASLVDSTEENSRDYNLEEINLNKPSLSDLDEILIAYDKVIRRIDRDTDKVTEFILDRNVHERNKSEKNKTVYSPNANPLNIKLTEAGKMKPSTERTREGEVKKKQTYIKDISNAQVHQTLSSNSSLSQDNLESVNDNSHGIVSSLPAFTDNPPIEDNSESTSYMLEKNTSSLSRKEQKDSSDKSKKSSMEKNAMKKSTIRDYSVSESVEKACSVDDLSYKVGVSNDNDEGVHIVKSNENTNEHDFVKTRENSLVAYTSDFTGSLSGSQKISSSNSNTKSSSYHLNGLMAEHFRNELVDHQYEAETACNALPQESKCHEEISKVTNNKTMLNDDSTESVEHQNETETACNTLPQESKCHEENSKVTNNKTMLNNDLTEKEYKSNNQESKLAGVETSYSKKCVVDNNYFELDTENVQVTVVSETEHDAAVEAITIGNNNKSADNQILADKSRSSNSTISSIRASDMSHSAAQKSNFNENPSKLSSTKCNLLNNRHQQRISEAQGSPGHLSSSEDSLRDCTSLQTSVSYTKSDKSIPKMIENSDMEAVNSHKTESNASIKDSSSEHQGKFESTRLEKERDQRDEGHIYSVQEATIRQFLATSSSVSSSVSDIHCRSHSSTSVETPSNTHSEGELYMPSSCSYSLGEVRILEKNNSFISQEALKSDSAVTIFVTRSILTSMNDTENSTPESVGEIRGNRSHF